MTDCLIFGTGRSGTTALVGSLGRSGAFIGSNLTAPVSIMPDGACEDIDILRWNDAIIRQLDTGNTPHVPKPADIIEKLARRPFALKDPRFSRTYRFWKPFLPLGCACLVTFRDPISFVESARRLAKEITGITETDDQLLQAWGYTYEEILRKDDGSFHYIHYRTVMDESIYPYLENLLGYPIVRGFVRPELTHPKEHPCPEEHRAVYAKLLDKMVRPAGLPPATRCFEGSRSGN